MDQGRGSGGWQYRVVLISAIGFAIPLAFLTFGQSLFLSYWWTVAIAGTAFSPFVLLVVVNQLWPAQRSAQHQNRFAFCAFLGLATLSLGAYMAIDAMKDSQLRQLQGYLDADYGATVFPDRESIEWASGPAEEAHISLKPYDVDRYMREVDRNLPAGWTKSDRAYLSPTKDGKLWFIKRIGDSVLVAHREDEQWRPLLTLN